jgi:RNA-directed DNA polymerase
MPSSQPAYTLVNLASAFLAGPWTMYGLVTRGTRAYPAQVKWIRQTARQVFKAFGPATAPTFEALLSFFRSSPRVSAAAAGLQIGQYFWLPSVMAPRGTAAQAWNVPPLTSAGQLADWLGVSPGRLDWLADVHGWTVRLPSPKLRHYVCRWQPRRRGRFRLVESPKPTLKKIQRAILHGILDQIPPHAAVHGFRAGRSILSYAAPHTAQRIVLRFDLRDFFPSVRPARIHALFRTAGYPEEVARLLTGLCTSRAPLEVWEQRPEPRPADSQLGDLLRRPHLPQGAPTSPALANLCAHRLDVRLHGLAQSVEAVYTRYADDLAFSGGELLERSTRRFQVAVAVIAAEEGFEVHFQKSRFMRQGVCQQLAGIVVNQRPNIRRAVYDQLKAILTNCVRHGPATQNRAEHPHFRSHLRGRIAQVAMIHPQHGAKLRALFERIVW